METWMKVGSALLIGAMLIFVFPAARHWLKHGPRGTRSDWIGAIIPIAAVIAFVLLLMNMV